MIVVPRAFALTLCERIDVDAAQVLYSLIGVFNFRSHPSYPTPPQRFAVHTVLFDGLGQGTLELKVLDANTNNPVYRFQKWWASTVRLQMVHLEIPVTQCVFPAPGRYLFELLLDGNFITDRYLELS